jgi:hypothetical protein
MRHQSSVNLFVERWEYSQNKLSHSTHTLRSCQQNFNKHLIYIENESEDVLEKNALKYTILVIVYYDIRKKNSNLLWKKLKKEKIIPVEGKDFLRYFDFNDHLYGNPTRSHLPTKTIYASDLLQK